MNWIIFAIIYFILVYYLLGFFRVAKNGSFEGQHDKVLKMMKEENDKKSRERR